jgi:hypothetical protein
MNKPIVIGLIAGLVVGTLESLVFSTESGIARLVSDLTLASAVLGVLVGLARPKLPSTLSFIGAGAAIGLLAGLLLAARSGMFLDDGVLMAINGTIIAAAITFLGNKESAEK